MFDPRPEFLPPPKFRTEKWLPPFKVCANIQLKAVVRARSLDRGKFRIIARVYQGNRLGGA